MNKGEKAIEKAKNRLKLLEDNKSYLNVFYDISDLRELVNLIETQQKEIAQKDNIIDAMAEQLTTPVHNKQWVIDYFEEKIK